MQQTRKLPWENPADDHLASSTPSSDGLNSAVAGIERVLRGIAAKERAFNPTQDPSTSKRDFSQYMERMRRAAMEIRAAHQRVQTAEVRVNALAQQAVEQLEAAETRVGAAEAHARDAEARAQEAEVRAQVAEARARDAESRARDAEAQAQAAEAFLVHLHETIIEPLATSLEESPQHVAVTHPWGSGRSGLRSGHMPSGD